MRLVVRKKFSSATAKRAGKCVQERGFTLLETCIALIILMIVGVGTASLFALAVRNNSSGSERAQALAIAQQQVERLRQQSFSTSGGTSSQLAAGPPVSLNVDSNGLGSACTGVRPCYTITTTIVDTSSTLKTITVTVAAQSAVTTWGGANPVTLVTQRAKSS